MKFTNYTINQTGLNEIAAFLGEYHRLGRDHFTESMLQAWAADAEFSLSEGNGAGIEIRAADTTTGRTETYTISDAGIDVEEVEGDE